MRKNKRDFLYDNGRGNHKHSTLEQEINQININVEKEQQQQQQQ